MHLNRRIFLQTASAAAAAPVLPAAAISAPVTTTNMQYMWASYFAKVHNASSPAMIAKMMHVDAAVAQSLYQQLLAKGALLAPSATGVSAAAKPIYAAKRVPGVQSTTAKLRKLATEVLLPDEEPADVAVDATADD